MQESATRVAVPVQFDGVKVLVEATPVVVAGSQETAGLEKVADSFAAMENVLTDIASSLTRVVKKVREGVSKPSSVEIEFGLAISAEGGIIVAKGGAEANLAIRLTYGRD